MGIFVNRKFDSESTHFSLCTLFLSYHNFDRLQNYTYAKTMSTDYKTLILGGISQRFPTFIDVIVADLRSEVRILKARLF